MSREATTVSESQDRTGANRPAGEAAAPTAERERILAASGWEREPRRRATLRELLLEHHGRIYLYAYAESGQRAAAIDRTRRALLRTARTLDRIPDRCSLSAWIFLSLEGESGRSMDCPEPWLILASVEESSPDGRRRGVASSAPRPLPADLERHLDLHQGCRDMREAYRRYLDLSEQAELRSRAGLDRAAPDLEHYLLAQFGEEQPEGVTGGGPWRHVLPRWGQSRGVAIGFGLLVLLLGVYFLHAWRTGQFTGKSRDSMSTAASSSGAEHARPASARGSSRLAEIHGAIMSPSGADLVFRWETTKGAESYRLRILSPMLDTLHVVEGINDRTLRLPVSRVAALAKAGPYLFQVEGVKGDRVVATSGLQPFSIP